MVGWVMSVESEGSISMTSYRRIPVATAFILLCSITTVRAAPYPAPDLFHRIETVTLGNGMTFLLLPRRDVPMVSGRIMVRVGNVDNPEGASGLAHMFEHMAFKGTDAIGVRDADAERALLEEILRKGDELTALLRGGADREQIERARQEIAELERQAAIHVESNAWPMTYDAYVTNFNAYTNQDVTVYQCDLPANNLEVWMLMESERLQHPVFREFYSELEVVKEERRQQVEDNPTGMAWELMTHTAYTRHPYRNPTIGHMADIEALNPRLIKEFHARYYTPANMVGVLVGDFESAHVRDMLEQYFGDIPPGPRPDGPDFDEPPPFTQRRATHRQGDQHALWLAFPGFAPDDPRSATAEMLAAVLSWGNTSRLKQRLDLQDSLAHTVHCWPNSGMERYAGLFVINVRALPGVTNDQVESALWQELSKLVTEPVTEERLAEIRRLKHRYFLFDLHKNTALSEMLAKWQTHYGSWEAGWQRIQLMYEVTAADITALARELFRPELATVVFLEPELDTEEGES